MANRVTFSVVACVLGLAAAAAGQNDHTDPLRRMADAVSAYVTLHREVERDLPPQKITPDAREIHQAIDVMAAAMRAARPAAAEGVIFSSAAGDLLRLRIRVAFQASGYSPADILAVVAEDEAASDAPRPGVNESFSWLLPSFMVPFVLERLPAMPEELEYRFIWRDLFLIDLHANLVVDVLRDALPDPDTWEDNPSRPAHLQLAARERSGHQAAHR